MRMQRKNGAITRNKQIRRKRIFLFFRILIVGFLIGLFAGYSIGKYKFSISSQKSKEEISKTYYSEIEDSTDTEVISTLKPETT